MRVYGILCAIGLLASAGAFAGDPFFRYQIIYPDKEVRTFSFPEWGKREVTLPLASKVHQCRLTELMQDQDSDITRLDLICVSGKELAALSTPLTCIKNGPRLDIVVHLADSLDPLEDKMSGMHTIHVWCNEKY